MKRGKRFPKIPASAILCFVVLSVATSATCSQTTATWNDATGNWTTASDWNCPSAGIPCIPNNAPGKSYDVVISTASGDVTLDDTSSLTSVTINTLSLSTASLHVEYGETLSTTGNATVASKGFLGASDELTSGGPGTLGIGGNLTNSGTVQVGTLGCCSGVLNVGGNLNNSGDLELNSNSTASIGGKVANSGTMNINQSGISLTARSLANTGAINDLGSIAVSGAITNSGSLSVGLNLGASLTAGSLTNSGQVYDTGETVGVSGALTNENSVYIYEGTFTAGSVTNTGSLTGEGSAITIGGNVSNGKGGGIDVLSYDAPMDHNSSLSVGGSLTNNGSIGVDADNQSYSSLTVSGSLINNGRIGLNNEGATGGQASLTVDGNYTQTADGTLAVGFSPLTGPSTLDVTGTASLDGTAQFDFLYGYIPGPNTDFTIPLEAGSVMGDFTSLDVMGIYCPTCTLHGLTLDTGSTPPSQTTPEPGTLVLLGTGLLGLAYGLARSQWLVVRHS